MCYPRVDLCDGTEPSIDELLAGVDVLNDITKTNDYALIANGRAYDDSLGSLALDGNKQYIQLSFGNGRNFGTSDTTICAWVKPDSTSINQMWLDWGENGENQRLYSGLNTSGNNNMGIAASGWSNGVLPDTNWHYQVIVMDGSGRSAEARSYDNGEFLYNKTYSAYNINNDLRIGARDATSYQWNGQIGPVVIYNKVLSQDEITQNFNAQKTRFGL